MSQNSKTDQVDPLKGLTVSIRDYEWKSPLQKQQTTAAPRYFSGRSTLLPCYGKRKSLINLLPPRMLLGHLDQRPLPHTEPFHQCPDKYLDQS